MTIYKSKFSQVAIPDVHLTQHLFTNAHEYPDRPAFIDAATGETLTYAELERAISGFAGGLRDIGFGMGDTMAVISPNSAAYAVAVHGAMKLGGIATTINPLSTADEVIKIVSDSEASVIFAHAFNAEMMLGVAAELGIDKIIISGAEVPGVLLYDEFIQADPHEEYAQLDFAEAVAILPYSSGTTGFPKGVMLTHRNLVSNIEQAAVVQDEGHENIISVMPFFHIYGFQVLLNGSLVAGKTVVSTPRFDLPQFLQLAQDYKAKNLYVVPPIVLALAKHPVVDNYDLSSVERIFSGAAPLGSDLEQAAAARLDCMVVQGYGMTELSPVSHFTPRGEGKSGSIGKLIPGAEARIVDTETGVDLPLGDPGEIWVRGDMVMKGYFKRDAETAATIDSDGWLHTGDIGFADEDGNFYISDRLKELIKFKGFQVPPAELEALLLTHPAVADVGVIGIPDEEAGEVPKAFVVLKPDASATAEEIMAFVSEKVASYKQVREVEFMEEIPKSASGKILRRLLRDKG